MFNAIALEIEKEYFQQAHAGKQPGFCAEDEVANFNETRAAKSVSMNVATRSACTTQLRSDRRPDLPVEEDRCSQIACTDRPVTADIQHRPSGLVDLPGCRSEMRPIASCGGQPTTLTPAVWATATGSPCLSKANY